VDEEDKLGERITGYKFFPNLNDSIMNLVYDMDDINVW
jgi:hypothetical protein